MYILPLGGFYATHHLLREPETTIFLKSPSHRFRGGRCATLAVYEHTTDAATTTAWIYSACQRHLGNNVMDGWMDGCKGWVFGMFYPKDAFHGNGGFTERCTWMVECYGICIGKYTVHGSYGIVMKHFTVMTLMVSFWWVLVHQQEGCSYSKREVSRDRASPSELKHTIWNDEHIFKWWMF